MLIQYQTRARPAGFTLIELMVVLVIIGVVTSFVSLSFGADPRIKEMEREAQRLAALVELASEESVLRSTELAIRFTNSDYEFFALQNGKWLPIENDQQFRRRELPDGLYLKLTLDDAPPFDLTADDEEQAPQVFLLSSGEMTPFTVEMSAQETPGRYRLQATLTGRLALESP